MHDTPHESAQLRWWPDTTGLVLSDIDPQRSGAATAPRVKFRLFSALLRGLRRAEPNLRSGAGVLRLTHKTLTCVEQGVVYEIPWSAVVEAKAVTDRHFVQVELGKPAGSYAVVDRAGAQQTPLLMVQVGDGAREAAVINHYRADPTTRTDLTTPAAADRANGAG